MIKTFNIEKSASRGLCIFICLWLLFGESTSATPCEAKCKGPKLFYKELKCVPKFEKLGDCCPIRYECPDYGTRRKDKCYIEGHVYSVGEELKNKHQSNPCLASCSCSDRMMGIAQFNCANVDCFNNFAVPEGCYVTRKPGHCCTDQVVCPKSPEKVFQCNVDGQIYKEGEEFYPSENPGLVCTCKKGYEGKNVDRFCENIKCSIEIRHSTDLSNNCAPIFYAPNVVNSSCPIGFRCQNEKDTVLRLASKKSPALRQCKFGSLSMNVGDELNQATDYNSVCVRCVCEVSPTPTCYKLPDNECDVTKHQF